MAAKRALTKIFSDKSYTLAGMYATALANAKEYKRSVDSLGKLREDLYGKDLDPSIDEGTVSTAVHDMVEFAFSQHEQESLIKDTSATGERHCLRKDTPMQAPILLRKENIESSVLAVDISS